MKKRINKEEVIKLNKEGFNNTEISVLLKHDRKSINNIIKELNLKPAKSNSIDELKIIETFKKNNSIEKTAEELNHKESCIKRILIKNKILKLKERSKTTGAIQLHEKGLTIIEISKELKIGVQAIYNLFRKKKIKPNISVEKLDHKKIIELHNQFKTVNEIAEELNYKPVSVRGALEEKIGFVHDKFSKYDEEIKKLKVKNLSIEEMASILKVEVDFIRAYSKSRKISFKSEREIKNEKMILMVEKGISAKEISEKLNLNIHNIWKFLRQKKS